MLYAQVGQHPLARATETSPKRSSGTLSCLSARPPDLAFWTGTRPQVVGVSPSIVPFLYSKRAAATRSPRSCCERLNVVWPLHEHTASRLSLEAPSPRLQLFCKRCYRARVQPFSVRFRSSVPVASTGSSAQEAPRHDNPCSKPRNRQSSQCK